jgi:hypothetical protein
MVCKLNLKWSSILVTGLLTLASAGAGHAQPLERPSVATLLARLVHSLDGPWGAPRDTVRSGKSEPGNHPGGHPAGPPNGMKPGDPATPGASTRQGTGIDPSGRQ